MKKFSFTSGIYEIEIKDGKILDTTENGEYFLDVLKTNEISYEIVVESNWDGVPEIKFTAPKDKLIPLLTSFDPNGRNEIQVALALASWNGDEDELWNTYLY